MANLFVKYTSSRDFIKAQLEEAARRPSAAEAQLKKAVDALSPRSKRAYRLRGDFDPCLGSCPYAYPAVSGGFSIPPPSNITKRAASQFDSPKDTSISKHLRIMHGQQKAVDSVAVTEHPALAPATGGAGAEPGAKPATGGAAFAAKHGGTAAPTIAFLESDLGMPRATHAEGHHVFPEGMPEGQTTMMDIEALLPENIIFMERSRQMHERILNEPRLRIWLPHGLHIHQHIVKVVRALLSWRSSLRFKVGIAVDVHHRFHTAHYAYMKPLSHLRDGVRYEGMHVVYIHKTRSTIAMAEHMAINNLLDCKEFQSKIANKKTDLDTHIPGDESDDDRYDAVGPHYLYIAWGEPGPCNRK